MAVVLEKPLIIEPYILPSVALQSTVVIDEARGGFIVTRRGFQALKTYHSNLAQTRFRCLSQLAPNHVMRDPDPLVAYELAALHQIETILNANPNFPPAWMETGGLAMAGIGVGEAIWKGLFDIGMSVLVLQGLAFVAYLSFDQRIAEFERQKKSCRKSATTIKFQRKNIKRDSRH